MTDIAERLMKISGFIGGFATKFESGSNVRKIEEFEEILHMLLSHNVEKYASITLRTPDEDYIGGVDFLVVTPPVQKSKIWCWPLADRRDDIAREKPRYNNLFDAALASLREHNGRNIIVGYIVINAQGQRSEESKVIIDVRDFFDNDNSTEGTVEAWWLDQLDKLQFKTEPVKWRGSDDPMTHD